MKRDYRYWSKEEVLKLQGCYSNTSRRELQDIFSEFSAQRIEDKAKKLKLKKDNPRNIMGNLKKLLDDTPEAFYWIGFLLADGHFSKTNRLILSLASKDKKHLIKFGEFISAKPLKVENKEAHRVQVMDVKTVSEIKKKFDINHNKTVSPPNFNLYKFSPDLWISLICGYIDGDGCIRYQTGRKDALLAIKMHGNWLLFLQIIRDKLIEYFGIKAGNPKLNKLGYAQIHIGTNALLKALKHKAIELGLPVLNRKWDFIS